MFHQAGLNYVFMVPVVYFKYAYLLKRTKAITLNMLSLSIVNGKFSERIEKLAKIIESSEVHYIYTRHRPIGVHNKFELIENNSEK